jgi:pyruvate,water dikinase
MEVIVKGKSACAGKATGKVKIVLTKDDFNKFKEGDILVAPHTDPDYVVLMTKAAAIVTDMGGITSHAAIVSREMGTPCIVGTNDATKVLKEGDLVEVDATKGVVYKLA